MTLTVNTLLTENILLPTYHLSRGQALAWADKLTEAVAEFTAGIEHNSSDARLFAWRDNVHTEMGHVAEAIADYDAAIAIDPGYAKATEQQAQAVAQRDAMDDDLEFDPPGGAISMS